MALSTIEATPLLPNSPGSLSTGCRPKRAKRASKNSPRVGDIVTVRRPVQAFYANAGNIHTGRNPNVYLWPGELAIVGAVFVPKVRLTPGTRYDYHHCLDFVRQEARGGPTDFGSEFQWRASVDPDNLVLVQPGRPELAQAISTRLRDYAQKTHNQAGQEDHGR